MEKIYSTSPSSIDRISQLPEAILHQILYFLSQKEATATCVLSKAWRYTWSTRPNIEFDDESFRNKKTLLPALSKALRVYRDRNLCIQEFRLRVSSYKSRPKSIFLLLNKWIPIVMRMGGLKKFELVDVRSHEYDQYDLPQVVFETLSLKYLNLYGCSLGKINPPYNKLNVKTLCLDHVYVEDETLKEIISCCPLIEDLKLSECKPLSTIEVNKLHNLKKFYSTFSMFDLNYCRIEIEEAPNLQEVCIQNCGNWVHEHNFSNVKSLKLREVRLSSKSFDYFSSNFHSLEKLMIQGCFGFRRFRLQSRTLKHFAFTHYREPIFEEATFDTPNMDYFEYFDTKDIPSLYFKTISSECKSDLCMIPSFPPNSNVTSWFLKLHEMLNALSKSEISLKLVLFCWNHEEIEKYPPIWNFEQYIEIPHPVVVESLRSDLLYSPSVVCSSLLNAFFRIFRPKNIELHRNAVHSRNISGEAEFLWKILTERDYIQNQEIIKHQSFWQQDLEEVSMETFDERQEKWIPFQTRSFQEKQEIIRFCFQLKWRETN